MQWWVLVNIVMNLQVPYKQSVFDQLNDSATQEHFVK
jgi:hypothetical protein